MGLFDKIKNIANKITGNAAKVEIVMNTNLYRNTNVPVTVNVSVKDVGITLDKIYVKLAAVEHVKVIHNEVVNGNSVTKEKVDTRFIHEFTFDFSGAQHLDANKNYSWVENVFLPEGVQPSYNVYPREVRWQIIAGLQMSGNDPDSGWKDIFVN
ncbi:hypothetical protein [Cytophaga aurantiaca]|uniref:hypothetical protein n=1 Tax=Cytophaga aurantiaca TaxID=29530 RepID=UPI000369BCA4|nr:hypothetical protein [Cytophaga aurantiaca]